MLLMSKVLKVSKGYVMFSVYRGLLPLQGGRLFEKPSILWVQWFTTSQFKKAAFLTFLDLSTTRVIAGKKHSQSPILKLIKGVLSNPVILTYLWQQSCILHTLTKLPAYCNLDLKGIFNA